MTPNRCRVLLPVILVIFLLTVITGVYGIKPSVQMSTTGNLEIIYPKNEVFQVNTPIELYFHVFNGTGMSVDNTTTSCIAHLYSHLNNTHLLKTNLTYESTEWELEINDTTFNETGVYPYIIFCNQSIAKGERGGYVSSTLLITLDGVDETGEDLFPFGLIIFLPLLLSLIMLIGAATLDQETHSAFKIFLFLASIVPFFISLNLGVMASIKYYDYAPLADMLSTDTYWFGLIFFTIIAYFLLYMIWRGIEMMAQKKKARLEY